MFVKICNAETSEIQSCLKELTGNTEIKIIKFSGSFKPNKIYVEKNLNDYYLYFYKIDRGDLVLDFSAAQVEVVIDDVSIDQDLRIFDIVRGLQNIEFRNLKLSVKIGKSFLHNGKFISILFNFARCVKMTNADIRLITESPVNLYGIFNNGNLDTHLETYADNFVFSNGNLQLNLAYEKPAEKYSSIVYGIYNNYGNAICVENSYIFAQNRGYGIANKAIGIYNCGRFARFANLNVKANNYYGPGNSSEEGFSYAIINKGLFMLLSNSNIVAEQGGYCAGITNDGDNAVISGNKILATHCISGKCIILNGNKTVVNGNMICSTSRNPRQIEIRSSDNLIENNVIQPLMDSSNIFSGNSVLIEGNRDYWASGNIVKGNRIINAKESGILLNYCKNITIKDNIISCFEENKPKVILEKTENITIDIENEIEIGKYILTDGTTEIEIRDTSEVYNGLIRIKENQKIKADIKLVPLVAETKTERKVKLSLGSFSTSAQFSNNASEHNYSKASETIRETDIACLSDNSKWQKAIEEINKI